MLDEMAADVVLYTVYIFTHSQIGHAVDTSFIIAVRFGHGVPEVEYESQIQ